MALSVLVVAAVTAGPSLDSLLCRDDAPVSAATPGAPSVEVAAGEIESIDEGLAPCVHGHCHHVAPSMPAPVILAEGPARLGGAALRFERRRIAVDDPQFGLMRPPRA